MRLIIAIAIATHERRRNISINHYSLPGPGPSLLLPHHLCIGDQSQVMTMEYYRNGDGDNKISSFYAVAVTSSLTKSQELLILTRRSLPSRPAHGLCNNSFVFSPFIISELHSYLFSVC